jgi:hypothetical protein
LLIDVSARDHEVEGAATRGGAIVEPDEQSRIEY